MSLLNQPLPMAPNFSALLQSDIIHLDQDHILVKDCSCPICQEPYLDGERPVQVRNTSKCDHVFGLTCLRKWLEMNNTCPMCRAALYTRMKPTRPQRHGTIDGLWTPNMGDLMTGAEIEYLFGPSSMELSTAGNRRQMARNRPGLGERRLSGETLVGRRRVERRSSSEEVTAGAEQGDVGGDTLTLPRSFQQRARHLCRRVREAYTS